MVELDSLPRTATGWLLLPADTSEVDFCTSDGFTIRSPLFTVVVTVAAELDIPETTAVDCGNGRRTAFGAVGFDAAA